MGKLLSNLVVLICIIMQACAPATVQQVRENPAGKFTFTVENGYVQVYKKAVDRSEYCYKTASIAFGGRVVQIEKELLVNDRTGNVTVVEFGGASYSNAIVIDISAISDTQARVIVYFGAYEWKEKAAAVEQWFKGKPETCRVRMM